MRNRPARLRILFVGLLVLGTTLLVPRSASSVMPAVAGTLPVRATIDPPVGTPHPSVPGMFFFGVYGWGRLTFETPPPRLTTVLMTTPWYSDATSRSRIVWGEQLLGYPIRARTSPQVPDVVDGQRQSCRYLDRASGRVVGYDNGPCEHRNKWARGIQDGFSYCIYKRCQTIGHAPQGGWSTFLAHSELWARVETVTPPPVIGFVPCGAPCDAPGGSSTTTTTSPPPTVPDDDGDEDPCSLPGVDCAEEICDRDGSCAPRCGERACPPPSICETDPSDELCALDGRDLAGVEARVVLSVPEVFVARGVLQEQSVIVGSISLSCDGRPCSIADHGVDPSSLELTGTLDMVSLSSTYSQCASVASPACAFRTTVTDRDPPVRVGDRVTAVFYTPTRSGEWLRVSLEEARAVVDVFSLQPIRDWKRSGADFVLVPTQSSSWQFAGSVEIPVRIVTGDGQVVGPDGLLRRVIGTTGRN